MSQELTDVIEFKTVSVSVDQAKRTVYVAGDDYRTTASEWRRVLAYLAKRFGAVNLSDEFAYVDGTSQFVAVGTY